MRAIADAPRQAGFEAENTMQFGILIIAHGQLAQAYRSTLEHVLGPQERLATISVSDSDDLGAKSSEITEIAEGLDAGSGVVIATDLLGATPSNLARASAKIENCQILYGTNLPGLIKLTLLRNRPLKEALAQAVEAGRAYLGTCASKK